MLMKNKDFIILFSVTPKLLMVTHMRQTF